jgi:hypothetical protein
MRTCQERKHSTSCGANDDHLRETTPMVGVGGIDLPGEKFK